MMNTVSVVAVIEVVFHDVQDIHDGDSVADTRDHVDV